MSPIPTRSRRCSATGAWRCAEGQQVVVATTLADAAARAALHGAILERGAWPLLRCRAPMCSPRASTPRAATGSSTGSRRSSWPRSRRPTRSSRIDAPAEHPRAGRRRPGADRAGGAGARAAPARRGWRALVRDDLADAGAGAAGRDERGRLRRVRRRGALFLDRPDPVGGLARAERAPGALVERLVPAREIRIEADGTDLRLRVDGRTWINSDGRRNMPSGEVFTGPLEDSAERHDPLHGPVEPARRCEGRRRRADVRAGTGRRGARRAGRGAPPGRARRPTPARASSASSGSAPTPGSTARPARPCSTRRSPAPSTSRSAAPTRRPAAPTPRRCTGT